MKIAVISDTHDNKTAIQEAFKQIEEMGITLTLHLGDIISPFVSDFIREVYTGDLKIIIGNNDGEKFYLKKKFEANGFEFYELKPVILEIQGRKIIMMHEPIAVESLARSGDFDIILYGHLHKIDNRKIGETLILNPGEACGYLTGKRTFAVLDLDSLKAEVIEF